MVKDSGLLATWECLTDAAGWGDSLDSKVPGGKL